MNENKQEGKTLLQNEQHTAADERQGSGNWQQISVEEAALDAFTFFNRSAVLSVGTETEMNCMTVSWGQIGTLWGNHRNVCTVYVRQSRYTKPLMDASETFTLESFAPEYARLVNGYLGRVSGRDEDKMAGSGLTLKRMANGAPAFEEGCIILECRKLCTVDIELGRMPQEVVEQWYSQGPNAGDFHTQYIGEITAVWVKN